MLKRRLRASLRHVMRRFERTVPVHIPVLQNELLTDRVALVTGSTGGIGFAIAKAFLSSGATVVVTGRSDDRVQKACGDLRKIAGPACANKLYGIRLDVCETSAHGAALDIIDGLLDRCSVDILVNNAGILGGCAFGRVTEEDFDTVLNTNLRGTYLLSQRVAQRMVKNKIRGNILNVASSSSLRPAITPYTLSKWAMRGLTVGLAKTLIPYDIVVNGLAPGPTATRMLGVDESSGIDLHGSPAGRFATSAEVAQMAVILVSGVGRMVVGDTIYMTGGAGLVTFDDIKYDIMHG